MVVALAVAGPAASDRYVGAALVEGGETEAVIAATLDAVAKRGTGLQRRGWAMRDRQEELESMEARYRRMREPQKFLPRLAEPAEEAGMRDEGAAPPSAPPGSEGQDEDGWQDDGVATLEEIRPERQGGAAVAQPMNRPDVERARFAPKSAMEDDFFRHLVATGIPVHIRCRDGYEILEAVLKDFGTYSLLVETDAGRELVFKHGIIAIRPMSARAVQE
jgi:sRNA-binding regulator protein Hfq